jgi:hypothetical protein
MKSILLDALHVFVVIMMISFVIFSLIGASGSYDHWTTRFGRRLRFRTKRDALPKEER